MENSAKILLLGKTGVGKSSFINYFLGKNVAKSAVGKPVTMDYFIPYEIAEGRYPIEIFDTKGLEALGANDQLQEIISGIKKQNNSDDIFNWFHTIFYCVSMSNPRFEDFEANFVRRLQQELTQHIHIILTHCDSVTPEVIANMRSRITSCLGDAENIEIFEVVCVSKKKRNGQVVEPRGREEISERVFDLLLEDIAFKLSSDYARTLYNAQTSMVYQMFADLDDFIDETVKVKTLFHLVKDMDETMERIDDRMDEVMSGLDDRMERIQKETDEKFTKILRPIAQLYTSYWGIATDSYVGGANLAFDEAMMWMDTDWMDDFDEQDLMTKVMPGLGKYMDEDGELRDTESVSKIFGMIGAGVGDLFNLKKNLKRALWELRQGILNSIPSQNEMQARSYERIVMYMKSELLPM